MANVVAVQILEQGPRNAIVKLTGALDTSDETRTKKIDVSALSPACTLCRVDKIQYDISLQIGVTLDWDATTPVDMVYLNGQGEICAKSFGGLQNNAGTGVTGDIYLTTGGWATDTQTYTIILHLVKQGEIG